MNVLGDERPGDECRTISLVIVKCQFSILGFRALELDCLTGLDSWTEVETSAEVNTLTEIYSK